MLCFRVGKCCEQDDKPEQTFASGDEILMWNFFFAEEKQNDSPRMIKQTLHKLIVAGTFRGKYAGIF